MRNGVDETERLWASYLKSRLGVTVVSVSQRENPKFLASESRESMVG